jgi:histidine triad (HIT) family protein
MEDCIFCKIAKGEIPSAKVYEDNDMFAFMDIIPNTKGHLLIIPKEHFENIFTISEDILQKIVVMGKQFAIKMKEVLGATGVNVSSNNGKHAGQVVSHFHLHIIPRYEDDGLQMYGPRVNEAVSLEELQKIAEKLQ